MPILKARAQSDEDRFVRASAAAALKAGWQRDVGVQTFLSELVQAASASGRDETETKAR
jgi:hypothetical protein